MGIPAIASNIYGISDAIINEQTGLLHSPKDVKSILDAMEHFLTTTEVVKKYGDVNQRASVAAHNNLLPIPQGEIDKNNGAKLTQNPGY